MIVMNEEDIKLFMNRWVMRPNYAIHQFMEENGVKCNPGLNLTSERGSVNSLIFKDKNSVDWEIVSSNGIHAGVSDPWIRLQRYGDVQTKKLSSENYLPTVEVLRFEDCTLNQKFVLVLHLLSDVIQVANGNYIIIIKYGTKEEIYPL